LEFDFDLYSDSIRNGNSKVEGETKFSNYVPDFKTGFLKHFGFHREMITFQWSRNRSPITILDNSTSQSFTGLDNHTVAKYKLNGNFTIPSNPLSFSYDVAYSYENKEVWKSAKMKKSLGKLYYKAYPISVAGQYKFDKMELSFEFNYKKMDLELYSVPEQEMNLDDSLAIDDYEYNLFTFMQYKPIFSDSKNIKTTFVFGLGGGYYLTESKENNVNSYIAVDNSDYSGLVQTESFLSYERPRGFFLSGFKTEINSLFVIDGSYEFSVFRDDSNSDKALSDQLFIGNNLLLKVYYLF